jgi:hypothetical protein
MIRQSNGTGTVDGERKKRPSARRKDASVGSVVIGVLVGFDPAGVAEVDYPGNALGALPARSILPLSDAQAGREIVLLFEGGDPTRPVVMGIVQPPVATPPARRVRATVDGETLTITAEKEIVLRCGEASLILTREGKIQLRGTYLLSRSSGVNRIQGGSIELN